MSSTVVVSLAAIGVPTYSSGTLHPRRTGSPAGFRAPRGARNRRTGGRGWGCPRSRSLLSRSGPSGRAPSRSGACPAVSADLGEDLAEDHEVGVRVAPVRPGSELHRAG